MSKARRQAAWNEMNLNKESQFDIASVGLFTHHFMNAGMDRHLWLQHYSEDFIRTGNLIDSANSATKRLNRGAVKPEVTSFDLDVANSIKRLTRNGVISQDDENGRIEFSNVRRVET